jgi:hypothetical protein
MSINVAERFKEMGLGEKIILIAGPLLFICGFLPWYSFDLPEPFGSVDRNGWESPGALWSVLAIFIGLIMAAVVAVMRFTTVQMPTLPEGVTWARIHLGLAVAAVLFIIIKFINESSDVTFGFLFGIILVAALAVGAFLMFQEEQKGGAGVGTSSNTPPDTPPPPDTM